MQFIWAIALLIVSYAISMALMSSAKPPEKANLEDFDFPQADEGTPQAVFFGDCWSPDFFINWYGNLRTSPIKSEGGKK